ncbi:MULTISPECIES: hypothetical protein [Paenibacillus]|nr:MULTISPECIES: hypothetical protein [Paenibacillus]KGP81956.1 hypothetical protein P364_0114130 [Paenibacillus sp. MAEPY2]KGP86042.1 hypothetical protein P363_0119605 [Paenibacillus sp. MAEPY1]MDN4603872.1 hypothetical protein [Paenibacillus vandeheii]
MNNRDSRRHYSVTWSEGVHSSIPTCQVQIKNQNNVVLSDYSMTFNQFAEAIIDTELRELHPLTIIGHRKGMERLSICGIRKVGKPSYETPFMNKGIVKYIRMEKSKKEIVVCSVPKQKWDMYYYNDPLEKIGHPHLLFVYLIDMKSRRVDQMFCFAVKQSRISSDTELFKYPYANVTNGSVCMGGNSLPTITDINQCATLHNLFFGSPSTNCYFDGHRNTSGITELRELYSKMQDTDFPDAWLLTEKITIQQLLEKQTKI